MDAELPSPGSEERRRVKARKGYVCDDCRVAIIPRQMYFSVRGVWDGEWRTYRMCEACMSLRNYHNFWGEDGPPFGELEFGMKAELARGNNPELLRDLEWYRARQRSYWLTNAWLTAPVGGGSLAEFVGALDGVHITRGFKIHSAKRNA
jgi:hypothetical protein